jgi:hypothetical protein
MTNNRKKKISETNTNFVDVSLLFTKSGMVIMKITAKNYNKHSFCYLLILHDAKYIGLLWTYVSHVMQFKIRTLFDRD